jgi:hypothetical protein
MDDLDKNHIKALDNMYSEMIKPENLITYFETDQEFKEWAELGSSQDLRAALIAFENAELFDQCTVLKQILLEKIDAEETN